eukprot:1329543-Amorphochlora_amoeboformis.AAC.2
MTQYNYCAAAAAPSRQSRGCEGCCESSRFVFIVSIIGLTIDSISVSFRARMASSSADLLTVAL